MYKFYGPERADVLKTFLVRFSQLAALNDPFEFLADIPPGSFRTAAKGQSWVLFNPFWFITRGFRTVIDALFRGDNAAKYPLPIKLIGLVVATPIVFIVILAAYPFLFKHLRRLLDAMMDEYENAFVQESRNGLVLVFSCSETWDSVPMWAHYASNHTGFVIGIDPSIAFPNKSPRNNNTQNSYIKPSPVQYRKRMPAFNPLSLNKITDFTATKMAHWAYEREWRFRSTPDGGSMRGSFYAGCELVLFGLAPQSVKEVVFGAQCSPACVSTVLNNLVDAGIFPALYQVSRGQKYGFDRTSIKHFEDFNFERNNDNPLPSLGDRKLERLNAAITEMTEDAERSRVMRWLSSLQKPT